MRQEVRGDLCINKPRVGNPLRCDSLWRFCGQWGRSDDKYFKLLFESQLLKEPKYKYKHKYGGCSFCIRELAIVCCRRNFVFLERCRQRVFSLDYFCSCSSVSWTSFLEHLNEFVSICCHLLQILITKYNGATLFTGRIKTFEDDIRQATKCNPHPTDRFCIANYRELLKRPMFGEHSSVSNKCDLNSSWH